MPKIVLVLTYYNRSEQLKRTLTSMNDSIHTNFSVIIVNDSDEEIMLPAVKYPITVIKIENKTWVDRDIPANIGFQKALDLGAEIIISQNAECYHQGDIISYADHITDDDYISFSAFSLGEEIPKEHDIYKIIDENNICVPDSAQTGWYNHPLLRPTGFDFCAAISRKNLIKLNGFDERFSFGIAYGDNYWVHRIRKLGLNIEIPLTPFVVHQWHDSSWRTRAIKVEQDNAVLFAELSQTDDFRAKHILTKDLV